MIPPTEGSRTGPFVREMKREFPTFDIRYKRTSDLQRAIHVTLVIVTLGAMRTYLTRYHTVLFGVLWVPDAWDEMSDDARYILLRHERVHLRQRARLGDVAMAFLYLFWVLPLGLAYGRARIEWEAYEETLRATHEVHGLAHAKALEPEIVRRFTSADYGWMWPFPSQVRAWFKTTIDGLSNDDASR
jgi:hypothetical protein